jgi:chorismate synthase
MLTYLTSGESHGPQLTAIIDGLPAGLTIDKQAIDFQLARRQKGYGRGGRMLIENDQAQFVGGVRNGLTMGGPISIVVSNKDWPNWTGIMDPHLPISDDLPPKKRKLAFETSCPRPGHADLSGGIKHGHHDLRNVLERASARETAARVALGAVARQLLEHFGVKIASHVVRIGPAALAENFSRPPIDEIIELSEASEVRCLDPEAGARMIEAIRSAKRSHDSLGGVVEVIVTGLPVGLGGYSQWSDRLDGRLSGALMATHSAKGVEIGLGFEAAATAGSEAHDEIFFDADGDPVRKKFYRKTNRAGGLEAGITNGESLVVRVAGKPISTLTRPLHSVDVNTKQAASALVERTDVCATPPLAVVCEAVTALVLAGSFLEKFGGDHLAEIERNYQAYLDAEY